MNVITIIQAYYDMKLPNTSDFENALMECSKEELVEFIMNAQCQGKFKDEQDKGSYNSEYIEIYGDDSDDQ